MFEKKNIESKKILKIGILGSTNGTTMVPIINAINNGQLNAEIVIVISNKLESGIIEKAKIYGINYQYLNTKDLNDKNKKRKDFDEEVTKVLKENNVDMVLMIGYMRIVSIEFCNKWKYRCFNVHPSLLPEFKGGMDMDVHSSVIKSGKKVTGCTIHIVSEKVDEGKIVFQSKCEVKNNDTPETLKKRVQELEGEAFIIVIEKFSKIYQESVEFIENYW
tara:strand:- start:4523 stop:5179 length:657 start_codon:yes stop_codon:yes gene_type:complete